MRQATVLFVNGDTQTVPDSDDLEVSEGNVLLVKDDGSGGTFVYNAPTWYAIVVEPEDPEDA
jgi:hypothetical protein